MLYVQETRPADWKYVSEGGATIVFSYKGPSHPGFDGMVLRLRKAPVVTASAINIATSSEETEDPMIEFHAKCMRRLIPPEHLPRLETIQINRAWLEALVKLQDHVRPEFRRQKGQVDLTERRGVLATDLVGGNWLAVEIKVNLFKVFGGSWILIVFECLSRSGDSYRLRYIFPRRQKPQRRRLVDSVFTHTSDCGKGINLSQIIVLWTYFLEMKIAFATLSTRCGTLGPPAMQRQTT